MTILVFTAALGDTDTVRTPTVIDPAVTYFCFSDRPCAAPYIWIPTEATSHPQWRSREIKILAAHKLLRHAQATLWHDASYRLDRDLAWVRLALLDADLAALPHPRRRRIEEEGMAIARYGYVSADQAAAHVARYRADGFTADVLTSSGLLARRSSAAVTGFNQDWWAEAQRWGGRDQGSGDYCAWKAHLRVAHLDGTIRANPYASWRPVPETATVLA